MAFWPPWLLKRNQLSVLLRLTSVWWGPDVLLHATFIKLGKILVLVSSHNFSASFSLTLCGTPILDVILLIVSHRPLRCYAIFFFSFFFSLFFKLGNFSWPILKFIDSFFCLLKSVNSSSECLISFTVIFKSEFLSVLYYNLYFFIDTFIWWDIILIISFCSLDMIFSCSLNTFIIPDLSHYLVRPMSGLPQGQCLLLFF